MREFNSKTGQRVVIIIFTLIIIFMPSAHAFPLHGGNGVVNATVYGVLKYEYGDGIYIDISASNADVYNVELIDSDNRTYSGNSAPYRSTLSGFPTQTAYNGAIRDMLLFKVTKDVVIKGLRVVPDHSAPFFINWTGMPQGAPDDVILKFYGAAFESNGMRWSQGNWNFDVNLTNNANQTAECNSSDFAMLDQFGWVYLGEEHDRLNKIPPGESLRFNVEVPLVSEIARPVAILFRGTRLNISAWA
jgi:hypothetical protein